MSLSFQSTRPVWGATTFDVVLASHILFQSTRPVWGATWRLEAVLAICLFQSTRPVWGATKTSGFITLYCIFQSTRPVWGATCKGGSQPKDSVYFNPRAPCGARRPPFCLYPYYKNFNPRAPCGARHLTLWRPSYITLFQSTRPVWGATVTCCANHPIITLFQSTRPVWGATLKRRLLDGRTFISIHAPRVGRDPEAAAAHKDEQISIHAPRVGRDSKFDDFTPSNLHKRYKRVLARPKNTREKGKIKQKLAYIHAFSAFLGCEGSGTFCALVLRTQYR